MLERHDQATAQKDEDALPVTERSLTLVVHRPEEANELTRLLPQTPQPSRCATITSGITQVGLGIVGLGAGILYLGPAQQCVESEQCGKFLADLIGNGFAVGVFTAGGADFSLINMYMSANSINAFFESVRKQKSTGGKVGKGFVLVAYALTQNASLLLASLGTSTKLWQTVLTVTGGLPGAMFGSVGIIDREIPMLYSRLKRMGRHMREFFLSHCCSPYSPVTEAYFRRMRHYERLQANFLERVKFRSDYMSGIASTLLTDGAPNPLEFLFRLPAAPEPKSWFASGMHLFGKATGLGLAGIFSSGFTMNTFSMLGKYIAILPLRIAATIFLGASSLYGNIKLTTHGITGFFDALANVLRGKPIQSSVYQLRPKTTLLVLGFAMLASVFSYAVANILFAKEFPDEKNPTRNGFLDVASLGIDLYHVAGLFEFYRLAFGKLTRNEQEHFIFLVEQEVARLQKMPLEEFIEFVEKNTAALNGLLELQAYDADPDMERGDLRPDAAPAEEEEEEPVKRRTCGIM